MYDNNSHQESAKKWRIISLFLILVVVANMGFFAYFYFNLNSKYSNLQQQIQENQSFYSNSPQYQVIQENISLSQLYENIRDSIVMIQGLVVQTTWFGQQVTGTVQGSGFIYNYTGRMVVITNYHVIEGALNITVAFNNGNAYAAKTLGFDAYSDLAVLSIVAQPSEFKPLQVASSSTLRVGDYVIAVGNPFGLTGSMTTGIVSQLGRTITESTSSFPIANVIQTSTPINSGNSREPLLNDKGQVVGITTAIVSGSTGIGFAIPSNTILREIGSLVRTGSYTQHPWLGIAGTDMTYEIASKMNLNVTYGMLITQITSGGPR